jgi:class 3 adenylate cyclase
MSQATNARGPVKRKISAILAADVAGYSRLVAEDEEEALRRLGVCRTVFDELVAHWGGRIFNTAGDAALAEFPSSVDAVRCALDVQEGIRAHNLALPPNRQMLYRIGITVADVVERDGDLLGDGVNIAARLSGLAVPGGICTSRIVYEQVANKLPVTFEDLGQRQVKNIPTAIHVFGIAPHAEAAIDHPEVGPQRDAARRRSRWQAGLALAVGAVIGLVAITQLQGLRQDTSLASAPAAPGPGGREAGFDDTKIRALAASQSIPLPPTLKIKTPAAAVPTRWAGYVGAWGGDEGWNGGIGRHIILVVESVDESGTVVGVLAQGPPTANAPDQRPARFRSIAGALTDEGFVFTLANAKYTFKDTADGLMWGRWQTFGEHGNAAGVTITIERIE